MSYIYNTRLVCKSNKKLLQKIDPNKIIRDQRSEFISSKKGAYHYITRNGTMHSSIVELSENYPTEVFIAQFSSFEIDDSVIETYKYVNGFSKCIKIEPNYMYCVSHLEEVMGKKTVKRFMKVVFKQFKMIDSIIYSPDAKKDGTQEKHSIHSSYTIIVEDKDYKIEATKIGLSYIQVEGYIKVLEDSIPRWQAVDWEKKEDIKVAHQMGNGAEEAEQNMVEPLPF